MKSQKLTREKT